MNTHLANTRQLTKEQIKHYIAWRCAQELTPGVVNLGIGIPIRVADYIRSSQISLHSENGILGVGPTPMPEEQDPDLINASKLPISELAYSSFFDSSWSFAMMRGGHIDATVVGALQVAENGDLASWAIPGQDVLGVGGVMDLVVGAKRVIIAMTHRSAKSEPKILPCCTYPLTARGRVDTIVTEYAVFRIRDGKLWLEELIAELPLEELKQMTPAHYEIAQDLRRPLRMDVLPLLKV
ncbi:3-oxoacid CoA-transferase subunit B [Fodinisporobacter ferrooxydans]|uniref:3-oxoacid CoA-transferase subunit B n=1 Tax=Fodinisporobacter ferrooxydans TaxID=2901836 RepID=A0ABY4CIE2_9BACL|nr:3-oxoacid CoA-transferase subunit B [Alicyclobacillaceae bacterium MYW30-H2]